MLYQSSKGAVEIDTMPFPYASNALNKLKRSEPERAAEIDALQAHVDKLSAETSGEDTNPRAVIGDNNPPPDGPPPVLDGRPAVDTHVADLLTEARNWADGVPLINQEQANTVGRIHRMLQQAATLVNGQADKEKKPHNDAITEIGGWQNAYTAKGLKKTPDGSLTKAIAATGNLSSAWLRKQEADRIERERAASAAALAATQAAIAARTEARETTDLAVIDRADNTLALAEELLREAKGVSGEKVRAGGGDGFRAMGLRSSWRAEISDAPGSWALACNHYKQQPEFMAEFHALIQRWADRDVRVEATRVRGVPGFNFIEEKVAA